MCGRVNVSDFPPIQRLMKNLGMPIYPDHHPRYNITPGSKLEVLHDGGFSSMEWGIEFNDFRHPNTRVETLRKRSNVKNDLSSQRCIIPINRYYEWPDVNHASNNKTRYCIHTPEEVILLAGVFTVKKNIKQFNVLTTEANGQISQFHHRMPVIIKSQKVVEWLSPENSNELYEILSPYDESLIIYECDEFVDNGRNEGKKCIEPKVERQLKLF